MRLVVLDVDGTLVDSQNTIVAAQRQAFAACGLHAPTRERSLSIVGLSLKEAFTVLVGSEGPVEALADSYRDAFRQIASDPDHCDPLFEGCCDLVRDLAEAPDVVLGIATGKSRRGVERILARHGWEGVFATIQTADDAPSKPDPSMLLQAMRETGIDAGLTTMVGDTTFDMAMARNAEVAGIGVAWGYHPVADLIEAGAYAIATDVAALASLLRLTAADRGLTLVGQSEDMMRG
jgi:phosphoglycolate phosphatase